MLVVIMFLFLFLIAVSLLVLTNNIEWYDNFIKSLITQNDVTINIFKIITIFGDWFILVPICILSLFFFKKKRFSIYVLINLFFATLINSFLKIIFARPRPLDMIVNETSFSYPSGHTFVSFAFYGFLIYLIINSNFKKNIKIISCLCLGFLILLIGTSRVYLNVHFPSDILGALLGGFIYLFIFIKVFESLEGDMNEKR